MCVGQICCDSVQDPQSSYESFLLFMQHNTRIYIIICYIYFIIRQHASTLSTYVIIRQHTTHTTHTHTHSLSLSLSLSHTLSHTHYTHTHTNKHTLTHTQESIRKISTDPIEHSTSISTTLNINQLATKCQPSMVSPVSQVSLLPLSPLLPPKPP
jgi:hypothetical protein